MLMSQKKCAFLMRTLDVHFHRRWSLPCTPFALQCQVSSPRNGGGKSWRHQSRNIVEDSADGVDQRYCVTDCPHTATIPRSSSASACGNDRQVFRNSAKKPPPCWSGLSWNSLQVDAKFSANACRCETERAPSWKKPRTLGHCDAPLTSRCLHSRAGPFRARCHAVPRTTQVGKTLHCIW